MGTSVQISWKLIRMITTLQTTYHSIHTRISTHRAMVYFICRWRKDLPLVGIIDSQIIPSNFLCVCKGLQFMYHHMDWSLSRLQVILISIMLPRKDQFSTQQSILRLVKTIFYQSGMMRQSSIPMEQLSTSKQTVTTLQLVSVICMF